MSMNCRPEIERLRYWQGQRLRSRDFRDQIGIEAQLRWWHNRALHNAFGVRYGYDVEQVVSNGRLVAVKIGCGIAYDCFGRELILQGDRSVELPHRPEASETIVLVVRYKNTKAFVPKRDRLNSCLPGSVSVEEPDLCWLPGGATRAEEGVPVARVSYEGEGQTPELDGLFTAPPSRAMARPRVSSGETVPGDTQWELWDEIVKTLGRIQSVHVGMQVEVDTSAAGFTETPRYFAWLSGRLWQAANIAFFPVPLLHIDAESYQGFRVRLWMPPIVQLLGGRARKANQGFELEFINYAREQGLHVCWVGLQCEEKIKCEPLTECGCETVNQFPVVPS